MKALAQGRQDFKKIIEENLLYVDKTPEIHHLVSSSLTYIFFSRPRRFGKSMLISTLKYLFQGEKELFKDLYIYDKCDFEPHPVIHLDFSHSIASENAEVLRRDIAAFLDKQAALHGIELPELSLTAKLGQLIESLFHQTGKRVVILVDEYDKPITDKLTDTAAAEANREVLRELFSGMKNADQYLRMLFITGVSRFARVSIFSTLNNMADISLMPDFHNLVGFKPEDIEAYYGEYLDLMQADFGISRQELMEQIKEMYNGYSWDGVQRLYNPYSITNAFFYNELENYWFQSGTPTFLVKMIKERKIFIPDLEKIESGLVLEPSVSLDNLEVISLLFQTGYLTIEKIVRFKTMRFQKVYHLCYPNEEVKISMLNYLLADNTSSYPNEILPLYLAMKGALSERDMPIFLKLIQSTFAKIPSQLHLEAEAYYHSLFYMLLYLLGAKIRLEEAQSIGRVDAILETESYLYVIEFKYAETGKMETLLKKALAQIHEKKYYQPYLAESRKILLLAVGFLGNREIGLKIEEWK